MNREIKFRGISKRTGNWVYGDLVRLPTDGGSYSEPPSSELTWHITNSHLLTHEFVEVIPETVGQFTGLNDANGTEIYEGDIISSLNSTKQEGRHVIEWDNDCAKFVARYGEHKWDSCGIDQDWLTKFNKKIIGNIYQNPELL